MIPQLPFEKIDQLDMRIEADDARGIGHEVRQRIDVVEDGSAVAVIYHVFHAADIDSGRRNDFLNDIDKCARWREGFDCQSSLRGFRRGIFE